MEDPRDWRRCIRVEAEAAGVTRALTGGELVPDDVELLMIPLKGRGLPLPIGPYAFVGDVGLPEVEESIDEDVLEGVEPDTEDTRCSSLNLLGVGWCVLGEDRAASSSAAISLGTSDGALTDRLVSLTSLCSLSTSSSSTASSSSARTARVPVMLALFGASPVKLNASSFGWPNDHLSDTMLSSPADQLYGEVEEVVDEIELDSEGRVSEFGRPKANVGEV